MFGMTKINDTVFTKIKDASLDDCELAKNAWNETADLACKVKSGAAITFGLSAPTSFVSSLMTLRGSRVVGPVLTVTSIVASALSNELMKVAGNAEDFATWPTVRKSATKSPEIFADYMTKNTRFIAPLYKPTLVRHLNRELPKSRNGKSPHL